jgi:phosphinothricin acetyltransferase
MTIRDAAEADLPAIVDIYNAAIPGRRATADTVPVSVEGRRPWFHQHTSSHRPLWVMDEEGPVAGWLGFSSFYGGRPAYHATAEVSLYVAPGRQRRGIGRALLTEAIRRAPSLGLKTLLYFSFEHNTPSVRLAESLGFQRWGHLPGIAELEGVERGLLLLGRRCGGEGG